METDNIVRDAYPLWLTTHLRFFSCGGLSLLDKILLMGDPVSSLPLKKHYNFSREKTFLL